MGRGEHTQNHQHHDFHTWAPRLFHIPPRPPSPLTLLHTRPRRRRKKWSLSSWLALRRRSYPNHNPYRKLSLLQCGDVEPNPGPKMMAWKDDYQVDPGIVDSLLTALRVPTPAYDLFSRPHNALFPPPPNPDAYANSWNHLLPVWANPPYDQLGSVLAHIEKNGAHMVLVIPAWRKHLPSFWRLSIRQVEVPYGPIFRKQGKDLLPPPNWNTWVLYIWYCPRAGSRGPPPPPLPPLTFLPPKDTGSTTFPGPTKPLKSTSSPLPPKKPTITYFRKHTAPQQHPTPPPPPAIVLLPPTTPPSLKTLFRMPNAECLGTAPPAKRVRFMATPDIIPVPETPTEDPPLTGRGDILSGGNVHPHLGPPESGPSSLCPVLNMPGYLELVDNDFSSFQAAPASSSWPRFTYTYEAASRACGAVVLSRHCDGFYQHQLDCSRHQDRRLMDQLDPYQSEGEYDGLSIVPLWALTPKGKRRRLNPDDDECDDNLPFTPRHEDAPPHLHDKTGRGEDLLTTNLEPNPGPAKSLALHSGSSLARGSSLLSCGDVEPNPGPPKTKARRTDDMVIDLAVPPTTDSAGNALLQREARVLDPDPPNPAPSVPVGSDPGLPLETSTPYTPLEAPTAHESRRAQQWCCPFEGCPSSRQHLSRDTFIRHLSRIHASAGEGIPQPMLDTLGFQVCTLHRSMHKSTQDCPFCAQHRTRSARLTASTSDPTSSSSTNCPYMPSTAPLAPPCHRYSPRPSMPTPYTDSPNHFGNSVSNSPSYTLPLQAGLRGATRPIPCRPSLPTNLGDLTSSPLSPKANTLGP